MTDSNTVKAPFRVNEPFTANDYADLIIRSSDGHDFHVLKGLLAMVSTIFKDMFSLPQTHQDTESDVAHTPPIVDVSESGPVVDALLRYIYPVDVPDIASMDVAFGVLLAAKKYEMDRPLHYVTGVISDLRSSDEECVLQAFALSCTHRLLEEAQASASASLRIILMDAVCLNALDDISGKAVIRLFRYHAEVRQKLAKLFSSDAGFPDNFRSTFYCKTCGNGSSWGTRMNWARWSTNMFSKAEQDVHTKGPMSKDVFSQETLQSAVLNACSTCMPTILRFGVEKLYKSIIYTIEKTVSEVKFEIPWFED